MNATPTGRCCGEPPLLCRNEAPKEVRLTTSKDLFSPATLLRCGALLGWGGEGKMETFGEDRWLGLWGFCGGQVNYPTGHGAWVVAYLPSLEVNEA